MSTHIEGGFRLTPGTDPFALIHQAKTALEPIRQRIVAEEVARLAAEVVHTADLTGEPAARGPLSQASRELAEETVKGDWRGLNCRIGFAADPVTGRIHLLVRGSQDYIEAVAAMDGVEDYAYWNSSEGPDDVSEEDWEERRNSWNRILPGLGHIGNNMAVWNLDADAMGIRLAATPENFETVEPFLPSCEDRAVKLVRDRIYMVLDRRNPLDFQSRMGDVMRRIEEAAQAATTEPFAAARKLAGGLLAPSDVETFRKGSSVSMLHANLDRVDWLVARALAGTARHK